MKIYIPPQIKHLLPALLIFIFLFLLGRFLVVPETFGDLGHYRAVSLVDNEGMELKYAGHDACTECHQDIAENKEYDVHSEVTCETCHGPGMAHVMDPEKIDLFKPDGRKFCGLCHAMIPGRNESAIFQVNLEEHYTNKKNCTDCHNPHQPWELKE